jgi:hypothetical protein
VPSAELKKWREMFLALPQRGEHALVGEIATELGRAPDDVLESLRHGKRAGWDRVGRKAILHFSEQSASAPASSVRVWLGEAGEEAQRKERGKEE